MKLKNLKNFNPKKVAKTETQMWQAYYRHNFFKLFILLLRLTHGEFQLSYFRTFKMAYYGAFAAISFRVNRGKENKKLILKKLTKLFKDISDCSLHKFDYQKAARLELDWWLIDRYPKLYKTTRREALSDAMSTMWNINSKKLEKYAEYRAQAMELQDEAEKDNKEADWDKVNSLLLISFQSLYDSIN